MAIKIGGTTVIDDSRNLVNVGGLKTIGGQSILGVGDIADIVTKTQVQTLTNKTIQGLLATAVALPAANIDLNAGNYFSKTLVGAITFTVSNIPAPGTVTAFVLEITNGGSFAVTWWPNIKWNSGTVPTLTTVGKDVFAFYTHDGGATWVGVVLAKDIK